MNYKLVIFDWDGTLMDSAAKIVKCFQCSARDANVTLPTDMEVKQIIGLGLMEAFEYLYPQASVSKLTELMSYYRDYFIHNDDTEMSLFPSVHDGLVNLKSSGYKLAVATGKARRGLDRVLEESKLIQIFDATRCVDEAVSKPHPQMLHDILSMTRVHHTEALMVGDTTFDLAMARAAGVDALGVSYGAHDREVLLEEKPLACFDSFSEVMEWIRKN